MAVYNESFMANTTNVLDVAVGLGASMGEPFLIGWLVLLASFLTFVVFAQNKLDLKEFMAIAGFVETIVATLLFFEGLLPVMAISIPFVIMIVMIVIIFFTGS